VLFTLRLCLTRPFARTTRPVLPAQVYIAMAKTRQPLPEIATPAGNREGPPRFASTGVRFPPFFLLSFSFTWLTFYLLAMQSLPATTQLILEHVLGWHPVAVAAAECPVDPRPLCNTDVWWVVWGVGFVEFARTPAKLSCTREYTPHTQERPP